MVRRVRRPPALVVGQREARTLAGTLGGVVREARRSRRMSLGELASKVGLSRTRTAEIERGEGRGAPLETWIALGIALDRPLAIGFSRPLTAASNEPADAGHLQIQEHVLALARAIGRDATFEQPTRPADPRRSTDVGIRDDRNRALIQAECWNTFGDLGAAVRSTSRKRAEAAAFAVATQRPDDPEPYWVATVWVIRATAANRALVARYPHVIEAAFPGSSRRWLHALVRGDEPPREPGLVWFDPGVGRLLEWRRRT